MKPNAENAFASERKLQTGNGEAKIASVPTKKRVAKTKCFEGVSSGRCGYEKMLTTNQKLIDDEMIELIKRDLNGIHPEDDPSFYCFSSEQLAEAKAMLAEEAGEMPDSFAEQFHKTREQIADLHVLTTLVVKR